MSGIAGFDPPLYAAEDYVLAVEASLARRSALGRLDDLVTLAWCLRERDSGRALTMADEADVLLNSVPLDDANQAVRRGRLHLTRAQIHALFARFDAAQKDILAAEELFAEHSDHTAARVGLGDRHIVGALIAEEQGRRDEVIEHLRSAEHIFSDIPDPLRRDAAIGWQEIILVDRLRQGPDGAFTDIQNAAPRSDHPSIKALHYTALGFFWLGEADRAQNAIVFARAHRLAVEAGMIRLAIICATRTSLCFQDLGDEASAGEWCDIAYSLARRVTWPSMMATCDNHFGRLLYCSENYDASLEVLSRALGMAGPKRAFTLWFLGCTLLSLHRAEEANASLALAALAFNEQGMALAECGVLIDRARAATAVGDASQALELVGTAREIARARRITSQEILICETLADIHQDSRLPRPEGMTAPTASIHFLEQAHTIGMEQPGWQAPPSLLSKLARAWSAAGDSRMAVGYYERALEATKRESTMRALDRFVASHIREEIERVRLEAEHQQQLAAAEARRADELQKALTALQEAQAGLAERTQELERLSLLDPLTGLANRRHFEERALSEIARVERYGTPLTFVTFDIDHFKSINDTYGHAAGDVVLREVAAVTRRNLRPNDFVARVGGEEFTAVLPVTDLDGALVIAERMRSALEGVAVEIGPLMIRATASFGVAVYARNVGRMEEALERADVALYRAKRAGRNRVEWEG